LPPGGTAGQNLRLRSPAPGELPAPRRRCDGLPCTDTPTAAPPPPRPPFNENPRAAGARHKGLGRCLIAGRQQTKTRVRGIKNSSACRGLPPLPEHRKKAVLRIIRRRAQDKKKKRGPLACGPEMGDGRSSTGSRRAPTRRSCDRHAPTHRCVRRGFKRLGRAQTFGPSDRPARFEEDNSGAWLQISSVGGVVRNSCGERWA